MRVYQFRHLGIYLPYMSGKRDSNSRPQPWQGCALPTELFPQMKGAKTSSGMSPNEISFSVCQCFAVQLSCLRLQRYTFFFIQQTFPYSFLWNNPKFLAQQGNLSQLGEFDNNRTYGFTLDFFSTTDWTDGTDTGPVRAIRQKQQKPLGEDGGRCPCCYTSALVL